MCHSIISVVVEIDDQRAIARLIHGHICCIEHNLFRAAVCSLQGGINRRHGAVQAHHVVIKVLRRDGIGSRRCINQNGIRIIGFIRIILGNLVEIVDRHLNVQLGLVPNSIVDGIINKLNLGASALTLGSSLIRCPAIENIFRVHAFRRSKPITGRQHDLATLHHRVRNSNLFGAIHEGGLHGVAPQSIKDYLSVGFLGHFIVTIIIGRNSFECVHISTLFHRPAQQNMILLGRIHRQSDLFARIGCDFGGRTKGAAIGIQLDRHSGRQLLPNGIQGHSIALNRRNGVGIIAECNVSEVSKRILILHIVFRPAQEVISFAGQVGGQGDHIATAGFFRLNRSFAINKGNIHLSRLSLPSRIQGSVASQLDGFTNSLHFISNLPASELLLFVRSSEGAFGQGVGSFGSNLTGHGARTAIGIKGNIINHINYIECSINVIIGKRKLNAILIQGMGSQFEHANIIFIRNLLIFKIIHSTPINHLRRMIAIRADKTASFTLLHINGLATDQLSSRSFLLPHSISSHRLRSFRRNRKAALIIGRNIVIFGQIGYRLGRPAHQLVAILREGGRGGHFTASITRHGAIFTIAVISIKGNLHLSRELLPESRHSNVISQFNGRINGIFGAIVLPGLELLTRRRREGASGQGVCTFGGSNRLRIIRVFAVNKSNSMGDSRSFRHFNTNGRAARPTFCYTIINIQIKADVSSLNAFHSYSI